MGAGLFVVNVAKHLKVNTVGKITSMRSIGRCHIIVMSAERVSKRTRINSLSTCKRFTGSRTRRSSVTSAQSGTTMPRSWPHMLGGPTQERNLFLATFAKSHSTPLEMLIITGDISMLIVTMQTRRGRPGSRKIPQRIHQNTR